MKLLSGRISLSVVLNVEFLKCLIDKLEMLLVNYKIKTYVVACFLFEVT